ncbi:MAG: FAD-dependent thymidylate synthase [candidate division NC10 bacterium]|nr:FAD-dependent thymidylate synthase [candidate division NC10 bacterium]
MQPAPPEADAALLRPYVTNLDRPVFALRNLPEEVVAVLFAYYSRSRETLRANLLKLLKEGDLDLAGRVRALEPDEEGLAAARDKARQFHEKWVVGYGHASVAEHAVAHLALEDVSILASKVVEDMRLAAYTEKSTRYVVFDKERYYRPAAIMASPLGARYREAAEWLLETYSRLSPEVTRKIMAERPPGPGQSPKGHETACRAQACDLLRYFLPTATLTNIGMTVNGRALEHLLTKMLSHPLPEARELAAAMKAEALHVIPTLIKYAAPNAYMQETPKAVAALAAEVAGQAEPAPTSGVRLVRAPEDAEAHLAAAILYTASRLPYDRDLHRHRMATQLRQGLTPEHGYEMPEEAERHGFAALFREGMARAADAYAALAPQFPEEAAYVLPLAIRVRVLFTWNLRELHHFIALRSGKQGHPAYRRIAQETFRELERVHPFLASFVRVDLQDYDLARA